MRLGYNLFLVQHLLQFPSGVTVLHLPQTEDRAILRIRGEYSSTIYRSAVYHKTRQDKASGGKRKDRAILRGEYSSTIYRSRVYHKTRQGKTSGGKREDRSILRGEYCSAVVHKTRQDKTRQDKTRQDKWR